LFVAWFAFDLVSLKVSVVIPTKNEEHNIGNCLGSLVKQTSHDFEVLVCDGGSTDKTEDVVGSFKTSLNIAFYSLKPDLGHQRRFGAKKAKGKYLCFIDADMVLNPKVVEQCMGKLSAFSSQPSARKGELTANNPTNSVDRQRSKVPKGAVIIPEVSFGKGFWAKVKSFEKKMYIGDDRVEAARFFTKEAYFASGGWKKGMAAGEDWDLTRRVRLAGYTIERVKELIHHNEGRIDLLRTLKRKFYYAQKSKPFVKKNIKGLNDYLAFIFRPAYFRNWREFVKHPVLGAALCFMKSLEFSAGFLGIVSKRFVKASYEKTK
jgi:glycosyltransferase involved in cell wall biosynthesis